VFTAFFSIEQDSTAAKDDVCLAPLGPIGFILQLVPRKAGTRRSDHRAAPRLPAPATITTEHLLTHTSGLRRIRAVRSRDQVAERKEIALDPASFERWIGRCEVRLRLVLQK
jgi:hypothetical protein